MIPAAVCYIAIASVKALALSGTTLTGLLRVLNGRLRPTCETLPRFRPVMC